MAVISVQHIIVTVVTKKDNGGASLRIECFYFYHRIQTRCVMAPIFKRDFIPRSIKTQVDENPLQMRLHVDMENNVTQTDHIQVESLAPPH